MTAEPDSPMPADFVALRDVAPSIVEDMRYATPHNFTGEAVDCYRPQRAVDDFVGWAADLADQRMKAEFNPRVDKSTLSARLRMFCSTFRSGLGQNRSRARKRAPHE